MYLQNHQTSVNIANYYFGKHVDFLPDEQETVHFVASCHPLAEPRHGYHDWTSNLRYALNSLQSHKYYRNKKHYKQYWNHPKIFQVVMQI